jgi:hypothetical protein
MTEIGALGSPKLKKMKRSEKRFSTCGSSVAY